MSTFRMETLQLSGINREFSSVSIDQAHEMQNKIVKGDGGIIGVTDNQEFLDRWLICAPEVTRLLHEFK